MSDRRAFVVAHHHPQGRVGSHVRRLVGALANAADAVVLVSTNAAEEQLASLPVSVRTITRPNVGYDFESYRVGIRALGPLEGLGQLVVLNTSFVCFDPARLLARVLDPGRPRADLLGLTANGQFGWHLQSYWISFENAAVICSEAFRAWWDGLEVISERDEVIRRHELGLTRHFASHGFRLAALFSPDRRQKLRALCRWFEAPERVPEMPPEGPVALDLAAADAMDPLHFLWDDVLDALDVVKPDLIRRNPCGVNLHRLWMHAREDAAFRACLEEAMHEG